MSLYARLKLRSADFGSDPTGSMPVEGILAFIFLAWWYVASFQFFDAYRQKNVNLKAAYTVADLISRETGPDPNDATKVPVNAAYVDGLNKMFDYLTYSNRATWIRVTSVYWDATQNRNRVQWSYATGSHQAQDDTTLQLMAARIPTMPVGDTIVMIETNMYYQPAFADIMNGLFNDAAPVAVANSPGNTRLNAGWFNTVVLTRPRFASCIPWDTGSC